MIFWTVSLEALYSAKIMLPQGASGALASLPTIGNRCDFSNGGPLTIACDRPTALSTCRCTPPCS